MRIETNRMTKLSTTVVYEEHLVLLWNFAHIRILSYELVHDLCNVGDAVLGEFCRYSFQRTAFARIVF
ncbi:Asp/Glu racemase [Trichinella spiralis]|uniref:Asp/Glu racemase n=1 Tax=Trichinella spiralis TaxID=6334 RepID=UPI0001EFED2E|nr:Asp/Glu racemase [Trichinella spiralis]